MAGSDGRDIDLEGVIREEKELLRRLRRGGKPEGDDYLGLAFSGGGIRSATFNLGVLQGLAKLKLLREVDYLSTVSGGGYIGSWLSALILGKRRALQTRTGRPEQEALEAVEQELAAAMEPAAVRFLRSYSNYLTPRAGLFSTDTLAAVANLLRNVYLNQATLVVLMVAILLLPRLLAGSLATTGATLSASPFQRWTAGLLDPRAETGDAALVLPILLILVASLAASVRVMVEQLSVDQIREGRQAEAPVVFWRVLVPGAVAAAALSYAIDGFVHLHGRTAPWIEVASVRRDWAAAGALVYGLIWWLWRIIRRIEGRVRPKRLATHGFFGFLAPWLAGALGGWLLFWLAWLFGQLEPAHARWFALGVGTALILKIFSLVLVFHLGLDASGFTELNREWLGRLGGMSLLLALIWLVLFAVAGYGPAAVAWTSSEVLSAGGVAWLASTVAGVWLGRSGKTGGAGSSGWREGVAGVAPYVFILGMLVALSWCIDRAWDGIASSSPCSISVPAFAGGIPTRLPVAADAVAGSCHAGHTVSYLPAQADLHPELLFLEDVEDQLPCQPDFLTLAETSAERMNHVPLVELTLVFTGCALVFLILGWRIDVNLFSMHHFYRNRLARCYLGASNGNRKPSPFTGFDPRDDEIYLAHCQQRPYHLVNTAINLVRTKDLAWQQRMAASFVFTPKFTGFEFPASVRDEGGNPIGGFRPTLGYMHSVRLGTAFAISGAAASPNMGYHSSPVMAFLLTLFNVRLGRWCGNPIRHSQRDDLAQPSSRRFVRLLRPWLCQDPPGEEWRSLSPCFGGRYLVKELLGSTNERSPFVYLSDGGHFENLGIYELVRRRCRHVIACDAGQDENLGFEDLGNAIRKCHTDLGVRIEIDVEPLRRDGGGFSRQHCVVGKIHYREGKPGVLVYLKATLTGDEPAEILQYARQQPSFPHQSTADQWFDETQFESYRALGEYIAGAALCQAGEWSRRPEGW